MVGFHVPTGVFHTDHDADVEGATERVFKMLGTIFSVRVTLLWVMTAALTLQRVWMGQMFFAPCLRDLEGKKEEAEK